MKKEFIPYEQALKLKEFGFDELTFCTWLDGKLISIHSKEDLFQNSTLAPLWQQAFDWFREKYNLMSVVGYQKIWKYSFMIETIEESKNIIVIDKIETYQEAQFACLNKLIEIVEQQNK
jgi:hypothetical protein